MANDSHTSCRPLCRRSTFVPGHRCSPRDNLRPQTRLAAAGRPVAVGAVAILLAAAVGGCGGQSSAAASSAGTGGADGHTAARVSSAPVVTAPVVKAPRRPGRAWTPVARVGGRSAAWIAQRSSVTLLRFDQRLVHLALHAGSREPGGQGWTYGDRIGTSEVHQVLAAFNGGFKLSHSSVGFMADGRVAVPLAAGLGSIVTYQNGMTQIGAWHAGVPAAGLKVVSVLQNLHLLVDRGVAALTVENCVLACWGATVGGGSEVARTALGIRGDGQLVWAAGEHLSPAMIAQALIGAGAVRAVQLDINPYWIAGYLYSHHPGGPTAVPVVPGQFGIPGRYLAPHGRDFFTILAN